MTAAQERRLAAILAADIVGYSRLDRGRRGGHAGGRRRSVARGADPRWCASATVGWSSRWAMVPSSSSPPSSMRWVAPSRMQQAVAARQARSRAERRILYRIGINLGRRGRRGRRSPGRRRHRRRTARAALRARRRAGLRHRLRSAAGQARPCDRFRRRAAVEEHRPRRAGLPGPPGARGRADAAGAGAAGPALDRRAAVHQHRAATPSRTISPTAWSRRSSPPCRACAGCS